MAGEEFGCLDVISYGLGLGGCRRTGAGCCENFRDIMGISAILREFTECHRKFHYAMARCLMLREVA